MTELDAHATDSLLPAADRLMAIAGRGRARSVTRLAGGKNNQVFRIETDNGVPLILKRYFQDQRDTRDRLGAEWGFLAYARSRGVKNIPEPLAKDEQAKLGLYSFVSGQKLTAGQVGPQHIDAALRFVIATNAEPRTPQSLPPGSEACFSLTQHEATIERRVARLTTLDADAPHADEARVFVADALLPAWSAVKARLARDAQAADLSMDNVLPDSACCLSPSDFGFHNALVDTSGEMSFLDFEYAGRDDPAKLVSDFFCQPEIPAPVGYHSDFVARLTEARILDQAAQQRCLILLDAYRVKWTCIILNEFLPEAQARRAFADGAMLTTHNANQLVKARTQLASIAA